MAFIFSTSHLPETRVRRPDHLEEEEDEDSMSPPPRAGMVRAFSHLPAKEETVDRTGPLSQRGAQAIGRQPQRTEEPEDTSRAQADGIAAAKASGVFDVVRQQFNRDDSPHFMDEDGNLRPRDEARQQDAPPPRDPRSPLGVAGAPPRPAWSAGHAAGADSSRSPRAPSPASDDTRPWYMPPITPEDLDPQHFDDEDAAGSHSGPKGRPEVQDLVYRTPGASTPKPGLQDLAHRFKGSADEAKENNMGYFQNAAAPADGRGHLAQQTNTYGAAPDNRANGSSYGYAENAGSGSQPAATRASTRPMSIPEILAQGRIAKEEYRKQWEKLYPEAKAEAEPAAEAEAESASPPQTTEDVTDLADTSELGKAKRLFKACLAEQQRISKQVADAKRVLQANQDNINSLANLRLTLEVVKKGYDRGKKPLPKPAREILEGVMKETGADPALQIQKLKEMIKDSEARTAENESAVKKAEELYPKALKKTQDAAQRMRDLEEQNKAEQLRKELEEKQNRILLYPNVFG